MTVKKKPAKKRHKKQNEVTAETFILMAKDLREQAKKVTIPKGWEQVPGAEAAYASVRDGLNIHAGVYDREAARLRAKR